MQRLAQGISALFAFARTPDAELARRHLTACEFSQFRAMSKADQLHSLQVLRTTLAHDPEAPPALLTAALLHDVGKSRYHLAVWQKTAAVVVEAFAPGLSRRLGDAPAIQFWRAPFIVRANHAKWGGQILRGCGSDADAILAGGAASGWWRIQARLPAPASARKLTGG